METQAHYVAVGAFVLTMIVLAFATVLWLGRAELTTQYAKYDIYFVGAVSGLRVGAAVEYSGVPVGKVAEIRLDPGNVEQIRVTVEIDASVAIKTDADAAVETTLLSAGLGDTNKDIAELAVNANTAMLTASSLLGDVDRSYSGPDGLANRLATAITDFDHVAKE